MTQLVLGDTINYKGQAWRVVRMIFDDQTLFTESGQSYVIKESYVQIKNEDGDADFLVHKTEKLPYLGPSSHILGLAALPWKES
jgi:hypothetical protein